MTESPVLITPASASAQPARTVRLRLIVRRVLIAVLLFLSAYILISYFALPAFWRFYARHHPAFEVAVKHTVTVQGVLGDPINVAFVGTEEDLQKAFHAAGWRPADAVTLASSLRIAADSVLHRAYETAPVSDLFVWKKKQDLAFQQAAGKDPRQRHHVRFWRSAEVDVLGRSLWLGAATFDSRVGFSHLTGQITHHIDANVDAERDKLVQDLTAVANISLEWTDPFHDKKSGKNGGGDPYFTDGRLAVIISDR